MQTSAAVTRRDDRDTMVASPGGAASVDLRPWEGLEGGESSDETAGLGSAGRACTCDLDICPHNQEMPSEQKIEFNEALLRQMMQGFNPHLITPRKERQRRDMPGKRSTARTAQTRGRYIQAFHAGALSRDIALDATLRSAALYQRHRDRGGMALKVEAADLHAKVRERKVGNLLLFVVDCSASMGTQRRILATQGAILSLLVDAYQRRDRVGLVTFREQSAAVILRPTSSTELAKKAFQSLAIGGTTPVSKGLLTAYELIQRELQKDRGLLPVLILITDGNANVSMGDTDPLKEAAAVGEMIRVKKIRSIVLGTGGQGWRMWDGRIFAPAQELAVAMGGEFYPMDEIST
ncbi:MAG: VWA domain-containing protein, partial [Candidatus Methylomirabilales bacterium]